VASTGLATAAVAVERQGLASGLVTTSTQLGTAFGVAVFLSLAAAYTSGVGGDHAAHGAIVEGIRFAYLVAAALAASAAVLVTRRRGRVRREGGRRWPRRGWATDQEPCTWRPESAPDATTSL
jgi:MFS family permease